jgi:NAD+ kinase
MKIAIHGRKFGSETAPYIREILQVLADRGVELIVSETFYKQNTDSDVDLSALPFYTVTEELIGVDYLFSLGGDGTLLEALTHVAYLEIPMLGINTGRLGFLATISKKDIKQALQLFFDQKFTFEYRSLISAHAEPNIYGDLNFALNEFAIMKKDTSSMVVVNCYINGEYLNTYWADGLMVATPTGSTGYSLSCGGPVVLPHSSNFIITPVSPHNLNVRPMIISDESKISFEIESRGVNFLTSLDSRSYTVDGKVKLYVEKCSFRAKLVKLEGSTFLGTLRNKLNWGLDARN